MIALVIKRIFQTVRVILLSILSLVFLLLVLFYLPPVQGWLKNELYSYLQSEMGITLKAEKLAITFPLNLTIRQATAYNFTDTLLMAEDITLRPGFRNLWMGRLRIDKIHLGGIRLDTDGLIEGIHLKGTLHTLSLTAKRWDMKRRYLLVNDLSLDRVNLQLALTDTTSQKEDSVSKPAFLHKIQLIHGQVQRLNFSLQMPADSMRLYAGIRTLELRDVSADLDCKRYKVGDAHLQADRLGMYRANSLPRKDSTRIELNGGDLTLHHASVLLKSGTYRLNHLKLYTAGCSYLTTDTPPAKGFDPAHIRLRDLYLTADSLRIAPKEYTAIVRNLSFRERSGFVLDELTSHLRVTPDKVLHATLQAVTPHSSLFLSGKADASLMDSVAKGTFDTRFLLQLGKQDVATLATQLPSSFHHAYPNRSLILKGEAAGNQEALHLHRLDAVLPGAFTLHADGEYVLPTKKIDARLSLTGEDLNFLTALTGHAPDSTLHIPYGLLLQSKVQGRGTRYSTLTTLHEGRSAVSVDAWYNTQGESYNATLKVDSLLPMHFLPKDSIKELTLQAHVEGRGTDIYSPRTRMEAHLKVTHISFYANYLQGLQVDAFLEKRNLKALLSCHDNLMQMDGEVDMLMDKRTPTGELSFNIWEADLRRLGIVKEHMHTDFSMALDAQLQKEETTFDVQTGDLEFSLEGKHHFSTILSESSAFITLLDKQIKERTPHQQELRKVLPVARMRFSAGQDNLLSHILNEQAGLTFFDALVQLDVSPEGGIRGDGRLYGIQTAAVDIDTIAFTAWQDTTDMKMQTTIINGPHNKFYSFHAQVNTVLRNDNGEIILKMTDTEGETGADLGLRGSITPEGFSFTFFPQEPIVAFRKMKLNEDNHILLRDDGRIQANLHMNEPRSGMSIEVLSNDTTTARQDLTVDLQKINVGDVIRSFPFLPDIDGLFSGNVHFVDRGRIRFTLDSELKQGKFNGVALGDLGLDARYSPDSLSVRHRIRGELSRNGEKILTLSGVYQPEISELVRSTATVHAFPLELADAFIPDRMVRLQGDAEGQLQASGKLDALLVNGFLKLDSATADVPMANLNLRFDEKQITIENNIIRFDAYRIYAAGQEPFTIGGNVDCKKMDKPVADLQLKADNYVLINNNKRTKTTELLGRLAVSMNTTVKGPLDAMKMRGNMRILGTTNLTYIMKDSPLSVQDRLSEQVTFVNLADSLQTDSLQGFTVYRPSTIDLLLNLTIDPAVRVRAELSADGTNYVDLEGGGSLVLQGDPQNDLSLTGRYTLNSGTMKYAFSMIPLKEFTITSGSNVQWSGNMLNPQLNIKAVEVIRSSVTGDNGSPRQVNFNVSVSLNNTLERLGIVFDISAPEDLEMQNQLTGYSTEERSKLAITTLATGVYMDGNNTGKGFAVGDALSSLLQSEINSIAGSVLTNTDFSIGVNRYEDGSGEDMNTDYSYKFARRFWNNRIRVVLGGTITQGNDQATKNAESFIDNVSIEYNFDNAGTKSVRIYYNKDYESLLEGEIIETGVGYIYRKKFYRWFEIFPWVKEKPYTPTPKKVKE